MCNSITMHHARFLQDPLALTTGLPARLLVAVGVVALIWAVVAWALGSAP